MICAHSLQSQQQKLTGRGIKTNRKEEAISNRSEEVGGGEIAEEETMSTKTAKTGTIASWFLCLPASQRREWMFSLWAKDKRICKGVRVQKGSRETDQ